MNINATVPATWFKCPWSGEFIERPITLPSGVIVEAKVFHAKAIRAVKAGRCDHIIDPVNGDSIALSDIFTDDGRERLQKALDINNVDIVVCITAVGHGWQYRPNVKVQEIIRQLTQSGRYPPQSDAANISFEITEKELECAALGEVAFLPRTLSSGIMLDNDSLAKLSVVEIQRPESERRWLDGSLSVIVMVRIRPLYMDDIYYTSELVSRSTINNPSEAQCQKKYWKKCPVTRQLIPQEFVEKPRVDRILGEAVMRYFSRNPDKIPQYDPEAPRFLAHEAVSCNCSGMIILLGQHQAQALRQPNREKQSPLVCALMNGQQEMVRALHHADSELLMLADERQHTPACIAIMDGVNVALLDEILALNPDVLDYTHPVTGDNLAHIAVGSNRKDCINILWERRQSLFDQLNHNGFTPILLVIQHRSVDASLGDKGLVMEDLVARAVRCNHEDVLAMLRKEFGSSSVFPGSRNTLSHIATRYGQAPFIAALLEQSPESFNLYNAQGLLPVHRVIHNADCDLNEALGILAKQLNKVTKSSGNTVAHIAARLDTDTAKRALLQLKALMNISNKRRVTPHDRVEGRLSALGQQSDEVIVLGGPVEPSVFPDEPSPHSVQAVTVEVAEISVEHNDHKTRLRWPVWATVLGSVMIGGTLYCVPILLPGLDLYWGIVLLGTLLVAGGLIARESYGRSDVQTDPFINIPVTLSACFSRKHEKPERQQDGHTPDSLAEPVTSVTMDHNPAGM